MSPRLRRLRIPEQQPRVTRPLSPLEPQELGTHTLLVVGPLRCRDTGADPCGRPVGRQPHQRFDEARVQDHPLRCSRAIRRCRLAPGATLPARLGRPQLLGCLAQLASPLVGLVAALVVCCCCCWPLLRPRIQTRPRRPRPRTSPPAEVLPVPHSTRCRILSTRVRTAARDGAGRRCPTLESSPTPHRTLLRPGRRVLG